MYLYRDVGSHPNYHNSLSSHHKYSKCLPESKVAGDIKNNSYFKVENRVEFCLLKTICEKSLTSEGIHLNPKYE